MPNSLQTARDLLLATVVALVAWSCIDDDRTVAIDTDPERVPTLVTYDVRTLISDSGVTKLRITTDIWEVFNEAEHPHWEFPKGAFLEQFDELFNIITTISCDSAHYYVERELWQLDGHVTILNRNREVILTQQLFYDQMRHEVRSDSFVHIEQAERVIEGYGFVSDEQMTIYHLNKPQGIFPVEEERFAPRDTAGRSVINK